MSVYLGRCEGFDLRFGKSVGLGLLGVVMVTTLKPAFNATAPISDTRSYLKNRVAMPKSLT